MHERVGQPAQPRGLIDVSAVLGAYYDLKPDVDEESQKVVFGTSGHRGSSLDRIFNKARIVVTTTAIVEYRRQQGIDGPLSIGRDIRALSEPAWKSVLEVLAVAGVHTYTDARNTYTPTPSVSHAILKANGAGTPGEVCLGGAGLVDGIVVTPSHNPPRDDGFKYNPLHGGLADSDATSWIAARTSEILKEGWRNAPRESHPLAVNCIEKFDFLPSYVDSLVNVIDVDATKPVGVRIGADPPGDAAVDYWAAIAGRYGLNLIVVNEKVGPIWSFMTLDWDGKIRMGCSSPYAMVALRKIMKGGSVPYDTATGNNIDSDCHSIVTADGLTDPNHYLAVVTGYPYTHRSGWGEDCVVGKTLVPSASIDRVVTATGRKLVEVSVGFKHFAPGLLDGSVGFGGEEPAGASSLRKDGTVWTTDKDGIVAALLASEILAITGRTPSQLHLDQVQCFGESFYQRADVPATKTEKARLARLAPQDVTASKLAGQGIVDRLVKVPGNGAAIGGLKVTTADAWFVACPSGTEDIYKIYAGSFQGPEHLKQVQAEVKQVAAAALASN